MTTRIAVPPSSRDSIERRPFRIRIVNHRHALLALAVAASLLSLSACKREEATAPTAAGVAPPAGETADQFIARVNDEFRKSYAELTSAQWLSNTYINSDTESLAAKANERWLTQLNGWIEQSKRFEGVTSVVCQPSDDPLLNRGWWDGHSQVAERPQGEMRDGPAARAASHQLLIRLTRE